MVKVLNLSRFHTLRTRTRARARDASQTDNGSNLSPFTGGRTLTDLRDALNEVASAKSGGISSRRLNAYLRSHQGRIVDGLQLKMIGHELRSPVWSVSTG